MENSYTDRIGTVINVELADKCKDEPSASADSDSMLSTRLSDTALNITENEQPLTCSISANDCKSYQQTDSLGHLHNEQKMFTERHSGLRLHSDPILVNSSLSVRDNASADVSSDNAVVMGNCSKSIESSFNAHSLNKGDENKLSGVVKIKPPIIKKKVSPVKKSNSQVKKSRPSPVSVPNRSSNGNKKSGVNLKQCSPISSCKVSQDNSAYTKVSKCKLKPKFGSTFNKMNSQHSAQCIKRGQVECDFVCNLYKSDNWIKSYFSNYDKISKQQSEQNGRGNARVVVRKVSGSSSYRNVFLRGGRMTGSGAEQCICSFCERELGWEGMTCLKLDVPLPSSIMYPTSLLRHYGIFFSVPLCGSSGKNSLVNICQVCYDLVLDGDAVYQKVQHITSQMRTLWHKQVVVREESSPLLSMPLNSLGGSPLHLSTELDASQKESVISTTKGKRIICGKKLPYILPRSSTNMMSPGSSLNVSSVPSKVSLRGTTKIECGSGKPRKMRSKPLTCGLCGTDFYLEDKWEHHLENYHRVQHKWRRFTPNMHSKLKARIINELTKLNDHKDSNSKNSKNITHTCTACESTFRDKSSFVIHLHSYHNMAVDDELLIVIEGPVADKTPCEKDKEIFPCQSDGVKILGNDHTKSNLNCAGNDCKTKSFSEVGDDEMLPLDDYGNNSMTAGDEVLDNTYCQNVKDSHNSKDISSEDLSVRNIIDRKMEDSVCEDSMVSGVTCMICSKNFKLKNELENHLETAHLLSVVLKGDGSGGVLDYVVDVQENEKSVNKMGGEPDLVSQETVNKASELTEWQSDNVLNNPFLSESKQTVEKGNLEEMGVPQCLVYECEICGRRVLGKKLLRNHLRRVHNVTVNLQDDDPQNYRYCKLCLFRTTTRALLRKHRKEKHGIYKGINQQQCETCGKMYSSVYIQEHMAVIHGNERKHTCELCGMKFFDKKGVKSHIYFEHANKEWKCENCSLTFKKYHQLRQHVIYVHSTKEFKCDKCSKVFKRKGDLTTHIKRMHERNVIVCNYCSRQYKNGTKYRNHLVNIHGLSKEETYSHRYARHKRANNKLQSQSEKVIDIQSEKVVRNPADSDVQDTCIRIEKAEPEFQLMEVMEATNNDSDEVTVLILS